MKTGKYRVYYEGQPCELLDVTVEGCAVRISGPLWTGDGVYRAWNVALSQRGEYIGVARLPHGGLAFHQFLEANLPSPRYELTGMAVYGTGSVDQLEWRLEEQEVRV